MSIGDNRQIVVDENIRRARAAFSGFGDVRSMPGRGISTADLSGVDILMVRSVTSVDEDLLGGTDVRFVGSATTGTDHVDEQYLKQAGITFVHAPGANADSVVEYVIAALLELAVRGSGSLQGKTAGIVGCGEIGGRLARRLPALGMGILLNDPPLAERAEARGQSHDFVPLEVLLTEADVLTLHTPLTTAEPHSTYHLIDEKRLASLKASAWLCNTCRGAVVDNQALLEALEQEQLAEAVLDVWENEPLPNGPLIDRCSIATPHIAGYSYDGRLGGTVMLYEALQEYLGTKGTWDYRSELTLAVDTSRRLNPPPPDLDEVNWLHRLVRQMYDIAADDRRMRGLTERPEEERAGFFAELRRTYPRRRGFSNFAVSSEAVPPTVRRAVSTALDVQLL